MKLLLDVGDVLVQRIIVGLYHKENPYYGDVLGKFDVAIDFFRKKLRGMNFGFDLVKRLTEIKYGSRLWLKEKGLIVKDKKLEINLCLEELEKLEREGFVKVGDGRSEMLVG